MCRHQSEEGVFLHRKKTLWGLIITQGQQAPLGVALATDTLR